MTRRFIVTIRGDDPTLAAQAHAAILAVPGVVCVVDTEAGFAMLPERSVPWLREMVEAPPERWAAQYQQDPYPGPNVGDTVLVTRGGREERAVIEAFTDGGAEVRFDSDGRGRWVHRWTRVPAVVPPTYTAADEEDGEP